MAGFLQKIFERFKRQSRDAPTPPPSTESEAPVAAESETPAAGAGSGEVDPPQLLAACAQSVGLLRDHNEDSMFMLSTTITGSDEQLPFGLYIVADGMGGHSNGEVASSIAVRTVAHRVIERLYTPLLKSPGSSPEVSIQEVMQESTLEAHEIITREAPGGGTTLTAALILGSQMTITHVGDSRACYISPQGELKVLTRDHSLVQRLVELKQLSPEEAAIHPQRNVLYRALGQGEPLEPDIQTFPLPEGGSLLICSDGLWGAAPENEITQSALHISSPLEACQRMVDSANQAGGPDNISVILVRLP